MEWRDRALARGADRRPPRSFRAPYAARRRPQLRARNTKVISATASTMMSAMTAVARIT